MTSIPAGPMDDPMGDARGVAPEALAPTQDRVDALEDDWLLPRAIVAGLEALARERLTEWAVGLDPGY